LRCADLFRDGGAWLAAEPSFFSGGVKAFLLSGPRGIDAEAPAGGAERQDMNRKAGAGGLLAALLAVPGAEAAWLRLVHEPFDAVLSNAWTYAGVPGSGGQDLFQHDATAGVVRAEWSEDNYFDSSGDPFVISNSHYTCRLPRPLADRQTFRVGATIRIEPGSIPDTTEFWQIASFGLYNLAESGPDRTLADDWYGHANPVKNAGDFVEMNYFINNDSFGFNPNISATIGGHVRGNTDMRYVTGSGQDTGYYHLTDMGAGHYLPEGANLYAELTYFGAETGAVRRRAHVAIYEDPARTNILSVNGVAMFYWTQPLPDGEGFRLAEAGFMNYPTLNYGGVVGAGRGAFDDLYVDLFVAPGEIYDAGREGHGAVVRWGSIAGSNYTVLVADRLGAWHTGAVVTATGEFSSHAMALEGSMQFIAIAP
jgi:hypothetical protein